MKNREQETLDLIQGLIDVTKEQQHEINVLRRQIAELRLVVFEKMGAAIVQMPRLEAALSAKEN